MKYSLLFLTLACTIACTNPTAKTETATATPNETTSFAVITEKPFTIPESFKPATLSFTVNTKKDTSLLIGNKGSCLHIPKNAFVDNNGKTIVGEVILKFKEYTNAAEIAFSSLPMMYTNHAGEQLAFNSSGMFELWGHHTGGKAEIAENKKLTIDYRLAQKNEGTNFYQLKKDSSNWTMIQQIQPIAKVKPEVAREDGAVKIKKKGYKVAREEAVILDSAGFRAHHQIIAVEDNGENEVAQKGWDPMAGVPDNGDRTIGTLLASGVDAGHTYPDVVRGLNIGSFGVYNCDQIYRLANRISINANYVDETGKEIPNLHVLSLIDLNYNGAFSFSPNFFTCSATGKNVLLLFTKAGDLYLFEKGAFEKMKIINDGSCTFKMKNVSKQITSSSDLAKYLEIKT